MEFLVLAPLLVLDLVFALAGSDRLSTEQFNKLKEFVKNMSERYPMSMAATHIGVIEHSTISSFIPLDRTYDRGEFLLALKNVQRSKDEKANTKELLKAVSNMFSFKHGGRPGAAKALVILTDDKPSKVTELEKATEPLNEVGVLISVVAIGENLRPVDFTDLVPDTSTIYPTNTTDELPGLVTTVQRHITITVQKRKFVNRVLYDNVTSVCIFIGRCP